MAWVAVGAAAVSVVGNYAVNKSNKGSSGGGEPAAMADPFASERPQYQQMLQQMMHPGEFTPDDPSYKWRFDRGMEGVNRGAASSGLLHSGNRLAALEDYGQNQASMEYGNQFQRLSQLAGADKGSPGVAGQIQQGQNAASSAFWQNTTKQIGGAVKDWYNTPSSTGGSGNSSMDDMWATMNTA